MSDITKRLTTLTPGEDLAKEARYAINRLRLVLVKISDMATAGIIDGKSGAAAWRNALKDIGEYARQMSRPND